MSSPYRQDSEHHHGDIDLGAVVDNAITNKLPLLRQDRRLARPRAAGLGSWQHISQPLGRVLKAFANQYDRAREPP